jgi:hypothetical protein
MLGISQFSRCSLLSISALGFSLAACGSAVSSEAVSHTGQASTAADPAFTACTTDDDCVAIKQAAPGCCDNGWLVAVNTTSADAYDGANTCTPATLICPKYIVNDTRVASCDATSNACTLVNAPITSTGDDDSGTSTSN